MVAMDALACDKRLVIGWITPYGCPFRQAESRFLRAHALDGVLDLPRGVRPAAEAFVTFHRVTREPAMHNEGSRRIPPGRQRLSRTALTELPNAVTPQL